MARAFGDIQADRQAARAESAASPVHKKAVGGGTKHFIACFFFNF